MKVLTDYVFYVEVLILLLMPYHRGNYLAGFFSIQTTNWFDQSGDNLPGTVIKETVYRSNDALLCLMLLRFYFIVLALMCLSPIEKLHSRRSCF